MAGTTTKSRITSVKNSDVRDLLINFNKLVDDVENIRLALVATCTKLDADAGVTDTNYAAQATVAAIDTAAEMLGAKIGNVLGTAVTE